ncbi:Retrovirus-related Pol polyprotein from transposon TNT 1-94 [Gossypium australe]|uniref:Retrovirus-related Pol polyprotein from transposon TNT 1-94 n=1 Tax=Gossypium australe TaxID=47621 RepID=A0A5B6WF53_9ROSI|nr:Retrovirus-related Pol polyprotein from transposon TNT 1-94 [Gossypium australe]
MKSNDVWDLVLFPKGVKAIGCKWVFKTKKRLNRHHSFCIMLALDVGFDFDLQQMDVKIIFLNGDLEEEAYMKQPKGFSSSDGEYLVCKLEKSIYVTPLTRLGRQTRVSRCYHRHHGVCSD